MHFDVAVIYFYRFLLKNWSSVVLRICMRLLQIQSLNCLKLKLLIIIISRTLCQLQSFIYILLLTVKLA